VGIKLNLESVYQQMVLLGEGCWFEFECSEERSSRLEERKRGPIGVHTALTRGPELQGPRHVAGHPAIPERMASLVIASILSLQMYHTNAHCHDPPPPI
jgi:hypothetical protein